MITKQKFGLLYRITALLVAVSGVIASCLRSDGGVNLGVFRFYTVQSNLLAVGLFFLLTLWTVKSFLHGQEQVCFFPRLEFVVVVDLLVTLLVYWVLLVPSSFTMENSAGIFTAQNLTVHLFTPLLCLLDYILFSEPGHMRYTDTFSVLIYPLAYVLLSVVLAFSGETYGVHAQDGRPLRYPYFFIDFHRLGLRAVGYILGLICIFLVISHFFYLIDGWRYRKKRL